MGSSRFGEAATRFAKSPWAISIVTAVVRLSIFGQLLPVQGTEGFYRYNEQARIAWAMVSGHGFSSPWINTPLLPTAQQPPLYPWILAGIFKLAGPYSYASLWLIEVCNILFAALTVILILKVGKQIFGPPAALVAAWIWAFWLDEAVVGLRVWESSLSALLLMLAVWLVLRLKASSPSTHWLSFGILAGIAALANTSLLSVFVGFWLFLFLKERRAAPIRRIALSVLFCVLTCLPWTVRNYVEFQRVLPVRDNFGFELWQGSHTGKPDVIAEFNQLGEIGFMDAKREAAMQFIREDPGHFLHGCVSRFFHFWSDPSSWLWLPLSVLTWIGCILALRRKGRDAMPLVIPVLIFPLVYYITHPGTYRHPIEPIMLLLAAFAIVNFVGKLNDSAEFKT